MIDPFARLSPRDSLDHARGATLGKARLTAAQSGFDALARSSSGEELDRVIGGYILDFYCPDRKLCVEIDGLIHKFPPAL
jgi:uncharacterized protein DUF559